VIAVTLEERLNDLKKTADEMAADVRADDRLLAEIRQKAVRGRVLSPIRRKAWALVPAACAAMAVLVLLVLPLFKTGPVSPVIESIAAGSTQVTAQPSPVTSADLPGGSVLLGASSEKPSFRSIWSGNSNTSFPMILVNGTYYRLLTSPKKLNKSLLGQAVGTVATYTTEMTGEGICSNTVLAGETVYQVNGMGSAAVAANIDGTLRIFQQVTAGSAGSVPSSLSQALGKAKVKEISLSGVARVTDPATAQQLYDRLVGGASYVSASCSRTSQSLHIVYDNGVTLQLFVSGTTVMSAGSWSCPDFFRQLGV
jgi:hypothetical protein